MSQSRSIDRAKRRHRAISRSLPASIQLLEPRRFLTSISTLTTFGSVNVAPGELVVSGSTIYGITDGGGSDGQGEVYSIPTTGGTPTVLGSFSYNVTGSSPNSITISGNTLYGTTANGGPQGGSDFGTVWSMPITGGMPTVLATVIGTNGYQPNGVTVSSGTLYVTTLEGGSTFDLSKYNYGDGLIFSIPTTGGTPKILADFSAAAAQDGENPQGELIVQNNTIYGITAGGGGSKGQLGYGTIFSVPASGGSITDLTIFSGQGGDGSSPDPDFVISGDTLYGAAISGSAPFSAGNYGEVFSMPLAVGTPTILGTFTGLNGDQPYGGVVLVGDVLYGTTKYGGDSFTTQTENDNYGNIFSIPISGGTPTSVASFEGTNGRHPVYLVYSDGTLYGTTADAYVDIPDTVYSLSVGSTTPAISSFTVGTGAAQRSMVRSLTLTFTQPVSLSTGAITLAKVSGSTTTSISSTAVTSDGGTTYVITPSSGTSGGSLTDGNYTLSVVPGDVHSVANPAVSLSGSTVTYNFFRLFGDSNGDGVVNLVDYRAFAASYLKTSGSTAYNSIFDVNSDNTVNLIDYRAFAANYLHTITT